jgi:hypothetical protein
MGMNPGMMPPERPPMAPQFKPGQPMSPAAAAPKKGEKAK